MSDEQSSSTTDLSCQPGASRPRERRNVRTWSECNPMSGFTVNVAARAASAANWPPYTPGPTLGWYSRTERNRSSSIRSSSSGASTCSCRPLRDFNAPVNADRQQSCRFDLASGGYDSPALGFGFGASGREAEGDALEDCEVWREEPEVEDRKAAPILRTGFNGAIPSSLKSPLRYSRPGLVEGVGSEKGDTDWRRPKPESGPEGK